MIASGLRSDVMEVEVDSDVLVQKSRPKQEVRQSIAEIRPHSQRDEWAAAEVEPWYCEV
jgi:hypothetical protein